MEALLNWQTVDFASPVEDWHNAPMLYLAGSRALDLTPYDEAKLKLYVEQGGMIVANAEAPSAGGLAAQRAKAFADSVRTWAGACSAAISARSRLLTPSCRIRAIDPPAGPATPASRG